MNTPQKLTGLFLGAGASYEIGMPLVQGLTEEICNWLTPEKLRSLNLSWRSHGGGYQDRILDDFISVLQRSDQHYETLLGYLEVQFSRSSPDSQEYHALYSWLVDLVYHLLYWRHINNVDFIRRNSAYYDGISSFVDANRPLWIFSLNHDVIIECLCLKHGIPLNSGFTSEVIHLPRRNNQGTIIGELKAEVLRGRHLESSAMPFFAHGVRGVNLLKIHGALDIFTFRDGKDLLKLLPVENDIDGPLEALRSANQELVYRPDVPIRATNEIAYADQTGELQFLRRSLLAGAFKFNSRRTQVLPTQLLQHFRSYINYVSKLVCIGYAFSDEHINRIMREWLEFDRGRRLEIVDPSVAVVPDPFLHIASQVTLQKYATTDYLDGYAGIVRSSDEINQKRFVSLLRQNKQATMSDFVRFSRERQVGKLSELIYNLPLREGNIDEDALGMPLADFLQREVRRFSTPVELIDAFVNSRENPR